MSYTEIASILTSYPRDIHTVPVDGGKPIWFFAQGENGFIYVSSANMMKPSSSISGRRKLAEDEFETMLAIYHRRVQGEHVAAEASLATQNQVYWYGIFAEFLL